MSSSLNITQFNQLFHQFVVGLQDRKLIPLQYIFLLNTFNENTLHHYFITQTKPYESQILAKDKDIVKHLGFISLCEIDDTIMEQIRILYVYAIHI